STILTIWSRRLCRNLRQSAQFNLTKLQLQRVARDVKKTVGRVRKRDMQLAMIQRRRAERLSIQHFLDCPSAILRGVDNHDLTLEHARNRSREQRIMSASEHKCIDVIRQQRVEIAEDHTIGDLVVEQTFFDQRDEQGAGATAHSHISVRRAQRFFVSTTPNRRARSNYANVSIAAGRERSAGTGL